MVKGRNESCTIERVTHTTAGLKEIPKQKVIEAAWDNTIRMFGLL